VRCQEYAEIIGERRVIDVVAVTICPAKRHAYRRKSGLNGRSCRTQTILRVGVSRYAVDDDHN